MSYQVDSYGNAYFPAGVSVASIPATTGTQNKVLVPGPNGRISSASISQLITQSGGSLVSSIFGRTGAITALRGDYNTDQVTEGQALYFSDSRARKAISLTTFNTSGPATYDSTTGIINIPQYGSGIVGNYVPVTRTITINGQTADLSANRIFTIDAMVYPSVGIPISNGTAWGTSIVDNSTNWNTAYSWGNHAGLYSLLGHTHTFASLTSIPTTLAGYGITDAATSAQGANADTAFGWGNHALAGYLTSFTETDPTVPSHVKAITTTNITNWNTAYSWGNHALAGYLTSFTETDPIWTSEKINYYTKTQADGRYLQSYTETDPVWTSEKINYYTKTQADGRYLQSFTETDPIWTSEKANYALKTYVDTSISNLIDSAPTALNTLNELAAALGDDANFSTSITTLIGTKEPAITAGTTAQYWRGDKTWQTLPIYTLSGLGGVPTSRTLTINGTSYDLSADRSWSINSMVYPSAGIAVSTGTAWGTSITDNSSNWNTAYGWGNHASAGYLTSITSLQVTNALGYTPYNSSNPAGYTSNTGTVTGTGTTNYLSKWTGSTSIGNSILYDNGSAIGINTASPFESSAFKLDVNGGVIIKNTSGVAAQLILIDSNPATGGNNGFVQLSAGGNTGTAFGQWQTYYGTSIASGTLRLQPAGGVVLVGSSTAITGAGLFQVAGDVNITGTFRVNGVAIGSGTTLNGTGFVKASGTTISYDNSTYYLASNPNGYITSSALSGYATQTWVQSQGYLTSVSDVWVNNSGDSMTGNLSFGSSGAGLTWAANTDGASITFESTSDGASGGRALSNLLIALTDNGDEGLRVTSDNVELFFVNTNQIQYKGANLATQSYVTSQGYLTGITSLQVTNALGYTPYNASNPNGYITGYTETDTLASVTARGASTSTVITLNNNLLFGNSGTTKRGIQGTVGDNDFWFIGGGATASNAGFLEIATGDDGQGASAEPIYVRQYGPGDVLTGTLVRTAALLDASGNTSFPGTVTAPTFSGSLSGNASTATNVAWTGVTGRPTALSSFTNDLGNYGGWITSSGSITGAAGRLSSRDIRTIAPNSENAAELRFGFTSWANNNSAPYADYLHLRSYSDGSGGSDNLVMFLKSGIGMRIWQQSYGSGTAYSSYVDVYHSGNLTNLNQLTNGPGYVTGGPYLPTAGGSISGSLTVVNNITVSSGNTTGNGIILADDGDIVDLNDAYCSMRFSYGVRIFSANRGGTPVITLANTGAISANGPISASNISSSIIGNYIVQRDANGYIYANHINFSTSESENPTISSFITSNGDGWSRKSNLAHVKNSIRGIADGTWGINISGNAATSSYSSLDFRHSDRDFPAGTLVQTNINYAVSSGDAFVLEIRGNSYFNTIPFDVQIQGYIYGDTIISTGGYSNGKYIDGIRAINYNGKLCFWWHSVVYLEGFNVKVYAAFASFPSNRVTSITNSSQPTTAKQVNFAPVQSLHSSNFNSYAPSLTGGNASGTWGINVTGSAGSAGTLSNNATISGLNFGGVFALTGSGASTGNSTGARLSESYGPVWNLSNSSTWHHQVINGSSLCGFNAGGGNFGNGNYYGTGDVTAYYSDERLKTKINTITDAIEKIKSLEGFVYVENDLARSLGYTNQKEQAGVSAQQIQAVLPQAVSLAPFDMQGVAETGEVVSKTGENYLTVKYDRIVPLLIEGIKEQQGQIELFIEAIKELKAEIDELKSQK
jgi:hypothetical protein